MGCYFKRRREKVIGQVNELTEKFWFKVALLYYFFCCAIVVSVMWVR